MSGKRDRTGDVGAVLAAERMVVFGPSGSGKSSLTSRLGEAVGLPVIELDALMHVAPGWQDASEDVFLEGIRAAMAEAGNRWIVDGNYSESWGLTLGQADVAIWLRLPFPTVYSRLVRRTLRRVWTGEALWGGNRESFRQTFLSRNSMLLWGITSWKRHHRKARAALRECEARVVVLRSADEVEAFAQEIERVAGLRR
jgi:adenylate kinase family enzyme